MTTEQPTKAVDYSITVPQPTATGSKYIFTVANLLTSAVRGNNPEWAALGGVIVEGANTLKYRNGYVGRCEIVEMRQFMDSDAATNIEPGQRRHHTKAYEVTRPNRDTGIAEKVAIGLNDSLLRMPFYPFQEIGTLTSQSDGLVEMPCKSNEDMRRAQSFLFSNWQQIVDGEIPLPERTSQLRAHFLRRLAIATENGSDFFADIARAAIRSCDQFRGWCELEANRASVQYEKSKAKGWGNPIGSDAVAAFGQSGLPRPDRVANDQAEKLDKLTDVMAANAENQSKMIDLQLAQMKGNTPPADELPAELPAAPPVTKEPEPAVVDPGLKVEVVTCFATTKSGAPCKNEALDDGFCKLENHNAAAEAAKAEEAEKEAEASKETA